MWFVTLAFMCKVLKSSDRLRDAKRFGSEKRSKNRINGCKQETRCLWNLMADVSDYCRRSHYEPQCFSYFISILTVVRFIFCFVFCIALSSSFKVNWWTMQEKLLFEAIYLHFMTHLHCKNTEFSGTWLVSDYTFCMTIKLKWFGSTHLLKRKRSNNFGKTPYWTDICWSIKLFMLLLLKIHTVLFFFSVGLIRLLCGSFWWIDMIQWFQQR